MLEHSGPQFLFGHGDVPLGFHVQAGLFQARGQPRGCSRNVSGIQKSGKADAGFGFGLVDDEDVVLDFNVDLDLDLLGFVFCFCFSSFSCCFAFLISN